MSTTAESVGQVEAERLHLSYVPSSVSGYARRHSDVDRLSLLDEREPDLDDN